MAPEPVALAEDIRRSLAGRSPPDATPLVFLALADVGLVDRTIAGCLRPRVSVPTVNRWRHGCQPIPPVRHRALIDLLENAVQAAERLLADHALKATSPTEDGAFRLYRARLREARVKLEELRKRDDQVGASDRGGQPNGSRPT